MNYFKELGIWQISMDLVVSIYQLTSQFPSTEKFRLIRQMNRSAVSVPSNIAEGAARNNPKEFNQFLGIAKDSIAEHETQLEISDRFDLCGEMDLKNLFDHIEQLGRMITKLQSSIK